MDFAFAPGASSYDRIMRTMYSYRPATTVVKATGINSLKDFFNHLAGKVTTPLTNILIGTHGNESGWMNIQLDPAFDAHTTYEAMEKVMTAGPRTCQLSDNIINPRPVDATNQPIDPFLFIRGCRIGVMTPFIQKFKDVINGVSTTDVGVGAPLFYHDVYEITQGVFESFSYDFHIFSKTPVVGKAALVALFDAVAIVDMYGTDITTAQWNTWIPRNINNGVDPLTNVNLSSSPVANLPSMRMGFYRYKFPTIMAFKVDPSFGALPNDAAGVATLLKSQLNTLAANPGTDDFALSMQSSHPFPYYKRYEYNSIEEMVDGLKWTLNSRSRVYTGQRYEYYVCPPVINNNANNELVFNFYASPTGGATASSMFGDNDGNYFQIV